jgi:hypothetical protein
MFSMTGFSISDSFFLSFAHPAAMMQTAAQEMRVMILFMP